LTTEYLTGTVQRAIAVQSNKFEPAVRKLNKYTAGER
jgi:hypothetical protein